MAILVGLVLLCVEVGVQVGASHETIELELLSDGLLGRPNVDLFRIPERPIEIVFLNMLLFIDKGNSQLLHLAAVFISQHGIRVTKVMPAPGSGAANYVA